MTSKDTGKVKVKVLEAVEGYYDPETYGPVYTAPEQSNWEEITQEELTVLKAWAASKNGQTLGRTKYYVVLTESNINIARTVQDYVNAAKVEMAKVEEKRKKAEEAEKDRIRKQQSKKEANDRRRLSELMERYPDMVKSQGSS